MTQGPISKTLVRFALPIFFGSLFQQLYNVVDSLVVGRYLGKEALAAVTSTGSLIYLAIGFLSGIFIGAGVIIARYVGARDYENMSIAIHTTIAFALLAGIFVTILMTLGTPTFLRWVGTPGDVFDLATIYLRTYFASGLFIVLYNACAEIFRATGDSKRPLFYLIISSIINVVLDIFFIAVLKMGVMGAALATVIAQVVSAMLAFIELIRTTSMHRIIISKIKLNIEMLQRLLNMGIPTGVQNSVIGFANVIVQSNINAFGSVAMAANGTYSKLEGFAFLPIMSFSMALTTFIGQNMGAKEYDRVKKATRFGVISGMILAEIIGVILFIFGPELIQIFTSDPEVIHLGDVKSKITSLFFFFLALSHLLSGVLRGLGKTKVPMMVMLICWCLIRITYVTLATHFFPDIRVVFWAYPFTWFISSVAFIYYYKTHSDIESYDMN